MSDSRTAKEAHEREAAEAVVTAFPEVSIHEMRDAPDADLLHQDGFHVGLEIVRAADQRVLSLRKRLPETNELIKVQLAKRGIQGAFWVHYDIQAMSDDKDRRAWDRSVPEKIATLLDGTGTTSLEAKDLVAHGVTSIVRIEMAPAPQLFVGYGWRSITEEGNSLAEIALASKDQKLAGYRSKNGSQFREYWLAIASLGPGTLEDGGFSMLLRREYRTGYDRVFLLIHASNGRLVSAQDVTPNTRSEPRRSGS